MSLAQSAKILGRYENYTQFLKCFLIDRSEIFLQLKAAAKKQKEQRFRGGGGGGKENFAFGDPFLLYASELGLASGFGWAWGVRLAGRGAEPY